MILRKIIIVVSVLLLTLQCKSSAQEHASTKAVTSQHTRPHRHRLRQGIAHKRKMSFGTRAGECLLLGGLFVFGGDGAYAQGTLTKQQQTLANILAGCGIASIAAGVLLIHFGGRYERNHPEKFKPVAIIGL